MTIDTLHVFDADMRTRSSAAPDPARSQGDQVKMDKATATEPQQKPLKSLILPSNVSDDARFVTLENPSTGKTNPYYFCRSSGLYEFTLITAPPSATRSILFTPSPPINSSQEVGQPDEEAKAINGDSSDAGPKSAQGSGDGYVSKVAQLHVATPVDALFFIFPILAPSSKRTQAQKLFQPLDDILDAHENLSKPLRDILLHATFREQVEKRMTAVCDTVDAGETMFRLNMDKLAKELLCKAENVATNGLPPSLEERFVRRELELPLFNESRENASASATLAESTTEGPDSQASSSGTPSTSTTTTTTTTKASSVSMPSSTSTPATPAAPADSQDEAAPKSGLRQLLRIRTALSFILSSYTPPHLSSEIENILKSPESPMDFSPLTEHLKHIAELRAKAQEARAMYDLTRKRGIEDEAEAAEVRAEKRRKEEEEKNQKAGESRAVKELKKVNTSGMKKLSAFFGKPTQKK